jgi:hypothetical protein
MNETPAETADPVAAVRDAFDAIWRGGANGQGQLAVAAALDENRAMLADLNANRIRPERVIGRGYKKPKTLAREYLTRVIHEGERDLATAGRSNSVNIANVLYGLPADHPAKVGEKDHRVRFEADDRSGTLFSVYCTCGDSEYGYSRVSDRTARDVERHMAGQHVLGRGPR